MNTEEKKLDKDINVRSKDDTEIDVGMIERSIEREKYLTIWLYKDSFWESYSLSKILDLIHRLQSENEELKAKRKKILANRVYSDETLKGWKKEDLIEQIRILEHNWAAAEEALNNSAKNSEKIITKQKAEIERLTEEKNDILFDFKDRVASAEQENTELQKQVDELKEDRNKQRKLYVKEFAEHANHLGEFEKIKQQAVKDTVKEILQRGKYCMPSGLREWIEERYGVEVE